LAVNLYEAMFVVDAAKGGPEFAGIIRHIASILGRVGAEPVRIEKWDERRLSYRIGRAKRGIYVLVYFRAEGAAIAEIRHDVQLSEDLLRVLVLRAEKMGPVKGEVLSVEGGPVEPAAPEAARPEDEEPEDEEAEEEEAEEVDA
jgi:small subunit ribosomal protein S6